MDDHRSVRLTAGDRGTQRGHRELGGHAFVDGVTNDSVRERVLDRTDIDLALDRRMLGECRSTTRRSVLVPRTHGARDRHAPPAQATSFRACGPRPAPDETRGRPALLAGVRSPHRVALNATWATAGREAGQAV